MRSGARLRLGAGGSTSALGSRREPLAGLARDARQRSCQSLEVLQQPLALGHQPAGLLLGFALLSIGLLGDRQGAAGCVGHAAIGLFLSLSRGLTGTIV